MASSFHPLDWSILVFYIVGTTWLGSKLAGKQQTIRDFFLSGRQLPWLAVCGSIVASEISGVTFVSVAANAYSKGGNFTYLQLAIGTILARFVIGYWFTPYFYKREIYSPYQFMGERLGPSIDRVTTGLFFLGGFLAQGARLFLAALVLDAITDMGIVWAIFLLGAISVVWTWIGGITTVVWTDVIQFVVLFVGGVAALVAVFAVVPGGVREVVSAASAAGKFKVIDHRTEPTIPFTLWCGILGTTFLTLASHGTDQMMAQRLFCCRDARSARKAVIGSSVGVLLSVLMIWVGLGLFAYFQHNPLSTADQAKVDQRVDYIFPIFILRSMPVGVKGLLFAAIFSAATATSTLSAMGQTALMTFYKPFLKKEASDRHLVFVSRIFILLAGVILCLAAWMCAQIQQYKDILNLALAMAAYTYGPVLGIFLLAILPAGRDARGVLWAVPCTLCFLFAINWQHQAAARWIALSAVAVLFSVALVMLRRELGKIPIVAAALGLVLFVAFRQPPIKLAFPWLYPIGALMTLGLGIVLGRKKSRLDPAAAV